MTFHRSLEMSINREDFLRLLPAVVPSFEVDAQQVRWSDAGRSCTIRLVPLPDRRLGRMAVARHRVEINLDRCSTAEGEVFMARFRRAFMRGGG